jgi:hypothetical protein
MKNTQTADHALREMGKGNWLPMDRALHKALPHARPYTVIEAAFSYQADLFANTLKSLRGYAKQWGWSLSKTINFIKNARSTNTDNPKDTHNSIKFQFIKPSAASKKQSQNGAQDVSQNIPNIHNKDTMYKENHIMKKGHVNKEQRKRSNYYPATGKPLSFKQYLEKNSVDDRSIDVIEYFLETYRWQRKTEHTKLKKPQWDYVIEKLFTCYDSNTGKYYDLDQDQVRDMIDQYFQTTFKQDCNYSLIHFNDDKIKINRFFEVCRAEDEHEW